MRVLYWSLIALLSLLFFPLVAWGVAVTGDPTWAAIASGLYVYAGGLGPEGPALSAVDPNQPLPAEHGPEDRKTVPIPRDALPSATANEVVAVMRPERQREQPSEQSTKMLPQVPCGLAHPRPVNLLLRQNV
jgi:hypothetical protein